MRAQDHRPQARSGYIVLAILGGITGALLARFVFPAVFERGGLGVFLALVVLLAGVVLLARTVWCGGVRP